MNPDQPFNKRASHSLPSDWTWQTVGSLASSGRNAIVGGPFGSDLVSKDYVANGVPVIRGQNMGPLAIVGPYAFVTEEKANSLKANLTRPGDVVFTQRGTLGQVSIVPSHPYARYLISQSQMKVALDRTLAEPKYLHAWFTSDMGQSSIGQSAIQTGVPHINLGILRSLSLAVPPLSEQREIACALSDVHSLVDKLDALIAKKRDLKQAAMQQLLTGKTRLHGYKGEWEQIYLGELFTFKNGLNKAKEFFGFGTPIVNYMDVFANMSILSSKLNGRVSLSNDEIKNFDVKKGDVLFTRTSETADEIGMAAVMLDEPEQTVFSGFVLRARPRKDHLCNRFKAYCFRSSFVRRQIIGKASYTTRALTNGRHLSSVVLPVPSRSEQAAIADVLFDMDVEIAALEARRDKTRVIKQGMMQELLTGRIRLI